MGALSTDKHVYFYYYAPHAIDHQFRLAVSEDGFNFSRSEINPTLFDQKSKVLPISSLSFVSFSQNKDNNYLIYSKSTGLVKEYFIASSNHLTQWKTQTKLFHITEDGIIVSNFTYKKRYIMIYGEYDLKMAYSYDFKKWYLDKKFILKSRKDQYDCF
ncbi:MAG: hypothetical protein M1326_04805, partial [Cyanobacteria bacterium]|nr:hypothetical protein [Cyanobacteriota bacterium]